VNNHDSIFLQTSAYYNKAMLFRKHQFMSVQEQVKFFVFKVPGATSSGPVTYDGKIIIESLTEHFYPLIYLKKQEFKAMPSQMSALSFPNLVNYELVFGQNPFEQLQKNTFEYSFAGSSIEAWSYYTMAVY